MKKSVITIIAMLTAALLLLAGCNPGQTSASPSPEQTATATPPEQTAAPQDESDAASTAHFWLNASLTGDYDAAQDMLDQAMIDAFAASGGVEGVMKAAFADAGNLISIEELGSQEVGELTSVVFSVVFENAAYTATITVDAQGAVAGSFFQPVSETPDAAAVPEGLVQTAITVDSGEGYPLEGYLLMPEDASADSPIPAILLVQGSGPNDKDETIGGNRVFEQLAYGLSQQGFATLRYDKRTYAHAEKLAQVDNFSVEDEYIHDVLAAFELLAAQEGVDPRYIYIAGHSQGAMLAPRFVAEGADAAGLILLAGTPRTFGDVAIEQNRRQVEYTKETAPNSSALAGIEKNYEELVARINAIADMTKEEAMAAEDIAPGMSAYYIYEMAQYDALELIRQGGYPVLVMQGSNDHQVYVDLDYPLYQEGLADYPAAQFKLYDGLNHLFMPSTAENMPTAMVEYEQPAQIPTEIFTDIAAWIGSQQ